MIPEKPILVIEMEKEVARLRNDVDSLQNRMQVVEDALKEVWELYQTQNDTGPSSGS